MPVSTYVQKIKKIYIQYNLFPMLFNVKIIITKIGKKVKIIILNPYLISGINNSTFTSSIAAFF